MRSCITKEHQPINTNVVNLSIKIFKQIKMLHTIMGPEKINYINNTYL